MCCIEQLHPFLYIILRLIDLLYGMCDCEYIKYNNIFIY